MKTIDTLLSLASYPIPYNFVEHVMLEEGLNVAADCSDVTHNSAPYKRAKVKIYQFLATAPNISQGGISYEFTSEDKAAFRKMADTLLAELGEGNTSGIVFGYQGDNF